MSATTVERASLTRVVRGTPEAISATFEAAPGVVTLTLTRESDGTVVVTGAATTVAGNVASYTPTAAALATLDVLIADWASASLGITLRTSVEVVGGRLFSVSEARTFDKLQLGSSTTYPDAVLKDAEARIAADFEEICCVSFVRRYYRATQAGWGTPDTLLPHIGSARRGYPVTLRAIAERASGGATWTNYTVAQLADVFVGDGGLIGREMQGDFPGRAQSLRVSYEHGYLFVPQEVKRAALIVAAETLVPTNVPFRANYQVNQTGTYGLAVATGQVGAWYGIPEVDATLMRYRACSPAVG